MDEFKILLKAIVDAKDTQAQLNAIKNLSVKIEKLNLDQSAITELRNQLSKNGIDVNLVLGNTNQLQNQAKQTGQQIGKLVSDSAEKAITGVSSKGIDRYFRIDPSTSREFENEMKHLVSQWTNAKGEMTDLKIDTRTVYDKDADASFERLHQATVTYKNDLDEVTKKTIAWRQVGTTTDTNGNEVDIRGFVEVAGQYSKALEKASIAADTFADKQTKLKSSLSDSLNSIKSSVADQSAPKPIKDKTNISSLQSQYQIVEQAIANVESASKSNFAQMEADARTQISALNDMVRQYRNAENVATSLRTKDFSTVKDVQVQNLQAFKDKIEGSNVPIAKMQTELSNLDTALNNAFDAESLTSYLNQMDVVQAKFKQMSTEITSANRNEKVGINVSGLESKITDIQRISPEINNFKTQINGAEVSVESLLEDLSNVNSQGDFSVVNTKFKAFTDSAKAAGIAVAELVTNSKKVDEIQLSIGNGDFETKILGYETALKKLGLSSEEITVKMQGVKSAYNELSTSVKGDNIIPDDVVAKATALNTEMSKLSNITKQIRLKDSLNADQLQVDQTVVRLNEQLRKNTAYTKQSKAQIRTWLDELAKGNVAEARLKQINSEAKQLHANMASLNKVGFSWIDKLKNAWSKFGGWSFATGTFMAGVHQTTEAFRELKEIDTLLTEISKTSDRTQKSLENLGKSAVGSANEYGATISGYLSGVKEAARAGFDESQQEEIAELSILAQSAGDMTDELANEYIIATNAAYKLNGEISKLNKVLDGQNYITNHNAVNMSELAEATKVVASQAASSNVEIDKLTASVGTMMAVTQQGGDIAARAFKAILMNIQQVSGEVANGEEISTDDLTKYQKACEELGVSLSEVKNGIVSLRDPMQVLKELSEAYTSLDKMDARRANLISAVGGKYRGNQLNALLENWDIYEKMLSEYSQGEGSALEEAQKTAESWQGLLNQISNNWTGFIQNFADDSLVTNTLKFLNELVKGANGLVESFGALPTLITAIGAGLGTKNIGKSIQVYRFQKLSFNCFEYALHA